MLDDYTQELQKQYKWYLDQISISRNKNQYSAPAVGAFYYKLMNGTIKEEINNTKWLEDAVEKLQITLAMVEKFEEREEYKRITKTDLSGHLKTI